MKALYTLTLVSNVKKRIVSDSIILLLNKISSKCRLVSFLPCDLLFWFFLKEMRISLEWLFITSIIIFKGMITLSLCFLIFLLNTGYRLRAQVHLLLAVNLCLSKSDVQVIISQITNWTLPLFLINFNLFHSCRNYLII